MIRPTEFAEKSDLTTSVEDQYVAAVDNIAFVDRSTIGRIEVTGKDAIDLLHRLSTQNLLQRKRGEVVGSVFTTDKGRMVDYVYILFREESLLLLTSPANEQSFRSWLDKFTIMEDIHYRVLTSSTGMITLVGPKASGFAKHVFGLSLGVNRFAETSIGGCPTMLVSREEFETTFVDVIFDLNAELEIKQMLKAEESAFEVLELGENAYEMFRISRGIPAYGHELSDSFNPYEVNLGHAISFTKGCYLGQEVIARLDTYQKIQCETYGIVFSASEAPEAGSTVYRGDTEVGVVTSVSPETFRGKRIALGILKKKLVATDDDISVVSNGDTFKGVVRRIPLVL